MGQTIAALVVVVWGGIQFNYINIFSDSLEFGYLTIPLTLLWIISITNSVNVSGALNNLTIGVSTIAFITMSGMAFITGNAFVANTAGLLVASVLGFLLYDSDSAKNLIGDTGFLFLGFMIAVLSFSSLKAVMILYIPIYILGIPIVLHYCFLQKGLSSNQAVSICYSISGVFSLGAFIFSTSILWGAMIVFMAIFVITQFSSKYRFV